MRALIVVCLLCGIAAADDRPWAKNISEDDQKAALKLYETGNKHFDESEYKEALEQYELALQKWPHPLIYFNAAVCLYNLSQYLKAADYLDKAQAFGDAPFDKKTLKQVNDYKTLVSAHVTELEVDCRQTDVKITLDGEVLMTKCPASATRRVEVEKSHAIVGEKPGYETQKIGPIHLGPGEKKTIEIVLKPSGKGKLVRRWNRALPWAVIGGGVAVGLTGIVPLVAASTHIGSYNRAFERDCTAGCILDPNTVALKDKAHTDETIAYSLFAVGGAITAAGVAMIWLNQPRLERAPQIAPSIGPEHAGVVVFGRW